MNIPKISLRGKLTKFILLLIAYPLITPSYAKYGGGSGSLQEPYQISTTADWQTFTSIPADWNKHFILTADLDLQGITLTPIGNIDTKFNGVFNGNGHTINNATIYLPSSEYIALFGYVGSDGKVINLGVVNVTIIGQSYCVGGLVGRNCGTISNCYSTGLVAGLSYVGGLVGMNYNGTIINCYSTGSASGTNFVGQLVGSNERHSVIDNCYSTGSIGGYLDVGGLVGDNYGSIRDCYSTSSVSGSLDVGGLVGGSTGTISNCYSTGYVTGTDGVGGLAGSSYSGIISKSYSTGCVSGTGYRVGGLVGNGNGVISNCYSTGCVSGTGYRVGGLVGCSAYGTISNCYSTGSVHGSSDVGGLVGYKYVDSTISISFWDIQTSGWTTSAGGTGKTTAEMQTLLTFTSASWDFTNETTNGSADIWRMCVDGIEYPKLAWQFINGRGDFVCPDGVNFFDYLVLANAWLSTPLDINWNAKSDLYQDSSIDTLDLKILMENWLIE